MEESNKKINNIEEWIKKGEEIGEKDYDDFMEEMDKLDKRISQMLDKMNKNRS
ncbi:unnamed protein product [Meloidogyne enterolobii]|uniref:Uncharacterized protein n=1 Tax=Meloidogyne enterolobii TaxID=390850 RepID=A0ACB0YLU5_MELEN